MKRLLVVSIIGLLTGCFPHVSSYLHLDGEGITHRPTRCGSALPLAVATYEWNGVRFDVTLEPRAAAISKSGLLLVRAPQQMKVSIPHPIGQISDAGGSLSNFNLRPAEHPENRFGAAILARSGLVDRYFDFVDVPQLSSSGSLMLPTLYLDDAAVKVPALKFERRTHAAVAPLNC